MVGRKVDILPRSAMFASVPSRKSSYLPFLPFRSFERHLRHRLWQSLVVCCCAGPSIRRVSARVSRYACSPWPVVTGDSHACRALNSQRRYLEYRLVNGAVCRPSLKESVRCVGRQVPEIRGLGQDVLRGFKPRTAAGCCPPEQPQDSVWTSPRGAQDLDEGFNGVNEICERATEGEACCVSKCLRSGWVPSKKHSSRQPQMADGRRKGVVCNAVWAGPCVVCVSCERGCRLLRADTKTANN